eukprot:TRINITY_DN8313_c0_g1_i1.p2 TRINITY_DN8313_c0_g1~~TRINITY_DN8313_c0_g1_i1.p2  ORF type:complete len:176 (+),score=51.99 TRINITY_DN8313_c0_g1_i1:877-1404(+)
MTALYWGALTLGRIATIPASIYLSSRVLLSGNLIGCIISCVLWLIFEDSVAMLWIGCFMYGLAMSSTFPSAIHLAENYMSLTGRLASLLVFGASSGEMVIPLVTSFLFARAPLSLMWILLTTSVLGTGIFIGILWVGKFTKKKIRVEKMQDEEMPEMSDVDLGDEPPLTKLDEEF